MKEEKESRIKEEKYRQKYTEKKSKGEVGGDAQWLRAAQHAVIHRALSPCPGSLSVHRLPACK